SSCWSVQPDASNKMRAGTKARGMVLLALVGRHGDRVLLGHQRHHGGAGDRDPAGDAVVAGPGSVLILQPDKLALDLVVPFVPRLAAGAVQAVADVEIREELLAAHR